MGSDSSGEGSTCPRADDAVGVAVAMPAREALATIAESAATYADEAVLARLSLRALAMVLTTIADTARFAEADERGCSPLE
jgi:hypothetical protein